MVFYFIFIFLFFRRQGFRMITFDRQAGPLQNFNRSHVMVIGRSVSFSDPVRPPGGGVGRPKHPKIPPPKKKKIACVSEPQEHFWKQILVGNPPPPHFFGVLRPRKMFLRKKNSVTKNFHPNTLTWVAHWLYITTCRAGHMHIYAYNTLGYHHLYRWQTLLIIDYMMQWPIYIHEVCACMCLSW